MKTIQNSKGMFYILLLFFLLQIPAHAELGSTYTLLSFTSFLERGYITRLGWQGHPISSEDPHIYLHDSKSLALLAEVEFGLSQGVINTQILKIYQPLDKLSVFSKKELSWFALEASKQSITQEQMEDLLRHKCQGEWKFSQFTSSPLFVTLYSDREATFLRISKRGSAKAVPASQCH